MAINIGDLKKLADIEPVCSKCHGSGYVRPLGPGYVPLDPIPCPRCNKAYQVLPDQEDFEE